jgi:elongation factor P
MVSINTETDLPSVDIPSSVVLEVTYAEPGWKYSYQCYQISNS